MCANSSFHLYILVSGTAGININERTIVLDIDKNHRKNITWASWHDARTKCIVKAANHRRLLPRGNRCIMAGHITLALLSFDARDLSHNMPFGGVYVCECVWIHVIKCVDDRACTDDARKWPNEKSFGGISYVICAVFACLTGRKLACYWILRWWCFV